MNEEIKKLENADKAARLSNEFIKMIHKTEGVNDSKDVFQILEMSIIGLQGVFITSAAAMRKTECSATFYGDMRRLFIGALDSLVDNPYFMEEAKRSTDDPKKKERLAAIIQQFADLKKAKEQGG